MYFPIALWLVSAFFDLLTALRRRETHALMARYMIGLGLLGAGAAISMGWVDLLRHSPDTYAAIHVRHQAHSTLAYATTLLYLVSFIARWRWTLAPHWVLGLAIPGAVLIAITGYLGGEIRARL